MGIWACARHCRFVSRCPLKLSYPSTGGQGPKFWPQGSAAPEPHPGALISSQGLDTGSFRGPCNASMRVLPPMTVPAPRGGNLCLEKTLKGLGLRFGGLS